MKGLVLEGGGAKGAYHAGVYKALLEENIQISGVVGTSIGALNGAMILQEDLDRWISLWEEISYSMIVNANEDEIQKLMELKLDRSDLKLLAKNFKKIIQGRGFDITPLKQLLDEYIDEDKIRKSDKDFGMVTFNITDFKPIEIFIEDIPKGKLKDYLLASAYLPVFKTERLGGKVYLDGGFFDNLPFRMLVRKGYKDLILVRTHANGIVRKVDKKNLDVIVISPSDDLGSMFSFEKNIAKKNINMGYFDCLKKLRGLLGIHYYIDPEIDEDYFLRLLYLLEEDKINRIGELLNLPDMPLKRGLFEYIIPKLGSILGISDDFSYGKLLIALLETKAEESQINRFKIYSFEELWDLVKCNSIPKEIEEEKPIKVLDKLIEIADISTIFNKEDIISKIGDILFCEE